MKNALVKLTRERISKLEEELLSNDHPSIVKGNTDFFPLKHSFSEGVYIREMLMEEGGMVIGKLHKYSHTWFLMKGEIMVASVFINVHPNPKNITNIEELENMLTCKSYGAFDKYKQLKQ